MRKTYLFAAILATALGCTPLAFAQPGAGGHGWHGHHGMAMGGHAYAKLNLTDAQRDQIRHLRQQSFAQAKPQMQQLRRARQAYATATPGTSAYQTAASNLGEAEADAARTRTADRADLRAQIYQVLTPTQRSQLADLRTQRQERRQQWQQFRQQHPLPQSSAVTQ